MSSPQPGTPFASAYSHDPESGHKSPQRLIRRILARRARLVVGVLLVAGVIVCLSDWGGGPASRPRVSHHDWEGGDMEGIWEDDGPHDEHKGWGWGFGSPAGDEARPKVEGDPEHQVSGGVQGAGYVQKASSAFNYIEPMHPDISLLPDPSELFADVDIPTHLQPPKSEPFPETRIREVISPPPGDPQVFNQAWSIPEDAFSKQWVGPEDWNPDRGEVRRVQWAGFAGGRDLWESEKEKEVREERREAVRRGFVWAWQRYKNHAWGHDEIRPVSLSPSDPFNRWGASIVDTLDTMLLMGLSDEYSLCRPHVNQLNFNWVNGRDWSQGYVSEPPPTDDEETPAEVWVVQRDRNVNLAVFETGIRYLGGMLGAYDLSGDNILLERSVNLAEVLGKAFNTESGLPPGHIDPGLEGGIYRLGQVSIAEVGSMSLELIRLSQITGNRTWFDLAQRAIDYLETRVIPRGVHQPLIPQRFEPDAGLNTVMSGTLALGGLADSYYEYLVKTYKLLGGSAASKQWRELYEKSVDKVKELLYIDIKIVPDHDILAIAKVDGDRLIHEIEHLTCFAGAMLGLGAKLFDRGADMVDAERFTQTCYWLSAATPTGLQPEVVEFYEPGQHNMYESVTLDGRPYHVAPGDTPLDESMVHSDTNGVLRWNANDKPVRQKDGARYAKAGEPFVQKLKGVPPGAKKVIGRGISRPETIESIFYMYRLTGNRKWQDKGWKMFVSWVRTTKVAGGFSSVIDVTKADVRYGDNMESFTFAETLKYHFLLQSEPDVMSLDDYVLNTEAHPFLTNPAMTSGSQRLWHPPSLPYENLGVRGQGTDAQKWARLSVLQKASSRSSPRAGGRGGRGMGGGGGDPNFRPRLPG